MLRRALNYVLQMPAVQLNVECKAVDSMCTFLLDDHLKLLSDGCFQCRNGCPGRCCLWETPSEEIWWFKFGVWGAHSISALWLMRRSANISLVALAVLRGSTILLESMFLVKVSTPLELSSCERPLLYLNDCDTPCIYKLEISRKHYFIIIKA